MISIVITTYKRDASIVERALKSVIKQTFKEWELFVIDDSPNDWKLRYQVEKVISGYCQSDYRIKYIKHSCNQGACAARNTGLKMSQGEYIAFLDDDDEWCPEKLEKQYQKLNSSNSDVALVYCGSIYQNDDTGESKIHNTIFKSGKIYDDLITRNFIGGTSFPLIRTQYLKEIGGFDTEMQAAQDQDVWLRLAEKYEITYIEDPLVVYHIHNGEQISTSPMKRINGISRKLEKHSVYFEKHKKQYSICKMDLAIAYATNLELSESLKIWVDAFAIYPSNIVLNFKALIRIIRAYFMAVRNKP